MEPEGAAGDDEASESAPGMGQQEAIDGACELVLQIRKTRLQCGVHAVQQRCARRRSFELFRIVEREAKFLDQRREKRLPPSGNERTSRAWPSVSRMLLASAPTSRIRVTPPMGSATRVPALPGDEWEDVCCIPPAEPGAFFLAFSNSTTPSRGARRRGSPFKHHEVEQRGGVGSEDVYFQAALPKGRKRRVGFVELDRPQRYMTFAHAGDRGWV